MPDDECPNGCFDDFFRADFARLVAFLRKAGFDPALAEDAAAEGMARAYRRWAVVDHPSAWVRKVGYRYALDQSRRLRTGVEHAVEASGAGPVAVGDPAATVGDRDVLLGLLARLPGRQRLVMAWHLEGYATDEIAGVLDLTDATVRSHLRHARAALRSMIVDDGPDGPSYASEVRRDQSHG